MVNASIWKSISIYGKVEQEKEVFFLKRNNFFKLDQTT